MYVFSRFMGVYLRHYNKIFWILFVIAGITYITAQVFALIDITNLDLVLGLILIVVGLHRIGTEYTQRTIKRIQDDTNRSVNELLQWAEKSYDYTRGFKDRHELRIHRLDVKRAELEEKVEEQFRDAVKKVLEIENRVNKVLKPLEKGRPAVREAVTVQLAPRKPSTPAATEATTRKSVAEARLRDLSKNQSAAIQHLRKSGTITNKDYRKIFRVSDKRAYSDLIAMYQMGLIKREGKGRSTHYKLAF
jgi:hypothetical protein